MKITHIRNATMVIEYDHHVILVDPMLSDKGETGPPFTLFRFKPRRNPVVGLPENAMALINKTTLCLITHLHPDHLDKKGETFLKEKNIPVICSVNDEKVLRKRGLNVFQAINYWSPVDFPGGSIEGIPALHGYGYVAKLMRNVMGFYLKTTSGKSIYLSSDTIYTEDVHKVLTEYQPDISVVAAGSAQMDLLQPLLMTMEDILKFIENAPGKVIANHLEAVNHCPTTREELAKEVADRGHDDRAHIPIDGEVVAI
ncbi:MBL fold metallo-hydrolase [Robertkochia marina]|uniref:MBL fold metallo-hydrolase n=1 Tax=Robertkochia marina TaxID=1227945 RepID=A0A4S3M3V7_9FLAO|nr:MBL fold metallo-hydrolase [Robertkochia marina]THD68981.1 MBL fold metallo-hydrolase [Robertkochia marina]TRZ44803.1 MBL fold metallo-hydrolase [Robertkochia marina]